jgi:outer membrane protein TolC
MNFNASRQFVYFVFVALACWLAASFSAAPARAEAVAKPAGAVLQLDQYLQQVKSGNTGTQGSIQAADGAKLRSREGDLLTSTNAFFNGSYSHDAKPAAVPLITYDFQNTQTATFGLSKLTSFGLTAKLSSSITAFSYDGGALSPLLSGNLPADFDISGFGTVNTTNTLELSQSLWSNQFGAATRAHADELEARALAQSYGSRFAARTSLADAEGTYWRLVTARQAVELTRENTDRAQKNYDWSANRARLQLGDRSDALQSQALLEVRKLNYQRALDEERSAARAFNSARGIPSEEVTEKLMALEIDSLLSLQPPKRVELRDDVKAAQQNQFAAQALSRSGIERDSPTLDVYGSLALNGQKSGLADAYRQSFTGEKPTATIGLRFSTPLDISLALDSRAGYRREEAAADLTFQRRAFEQEQQWRDLSVQLIDSQRRLKLAVSIEKVQQSKLNYERDRYRTGRSTSFQVLSFETDYALSQLSRLQAQSEVLGVQTQMKLFGEEL